MRTSLSSTIALALCARFLRAQSVPLVYLPAATAKSPVKFDVIAGLRVAANGSVLVNDARARQITMLDSTLTDWKVVVDSVDGTDHSYGMMPSRLVPYLGDSSLFADANSSTLLVRDATGKMVRAIAPPPLEFGLIYGTLLNGPGGTDAKGRLIFGGGITSADDDSSFVLRADL